MSDTARGSARETEERFLSGHAGRMFLTLTMGLAAVRIGRRALPPLLPAIIDDLGITPFRAGIALSVMAVAFALLQYPSGRLADRLTRKTALVASLGTVAVGAAILATTPTYAVLLVGAAVMGAGEGLYGPAGRALLSDLFEERRGQAFGLFTTASDLGGVLAAGLVIAVLAVAGWRAAFPPMIAALALLLVSFHRWGRERIVLAPIEFGARETARRLFGGSRFRWLVFAYSLFAFTAQGVVGFLPTMLQAHHGLPAGLANGLFALLFAVGLVSRPVAGGLSDRFPRLYVGGGGLVLAAAGVAAFVLAPTAAVVVAGVVVFALGQKAFPPAVQAHLMDVFPDSNMGGDLGATRTVYIGLGSLGPAYVGYVAGRWGYAPAFAGFIVCLFVAGAIMIGLSYTVGRSR